MRKISSKLSCTTKPDFVNKTKKRNHYIIINILVKQGRII